MSSTFSDLYVLVDVGFDTGLLRWFLQFRNKKYYVVSSLLASKIVITEGSGFQFGWIDDNVDNTNYFWHVRERYWSDDIKEVRQANDTIFLSLNRKESDDRNVKGILPKELNENVEYLDYAYSVSGNYAGLGFIDLKSKDYSLKDEDYQILDTIRGKQIITENLNHETVGTFPRIRLRAHVNDVKELVITRNTCVIVGK